MSNHKLIQILTAVGIGVNAILLSPQVSPAINTFPTKIADKQNNGDAPNRAWKIAHAIETAIVSVVGRDANQSGIISVAVLLDHLVVY